MKFKLLIILSLVTSHYATAMNVPVENHFAKKAKVGAETARSKGQKKQKGLVKEQGGKRNCDFHHAFTVCLVYGSALAMVAYLQPSKESPISYYKKDIEKIKADACRAGYALGYMDANTISSESIDALRTKYEGVCPASLELRRT